MESNELSNMNIINMIKDLKLDKYFGGNIVRMNYQNINEKEIIYN